MADEFGNPGQEGLGTDGGTTYAPPQRNKPSSWHQLSAGHLCKGVVDRPRTSKDTKFVVAPGMGIFQICRGYEMTSGGIALPQNTKPSMMVIFCHQRGPDLVTPSGSVQKFLVQAGDYCLVWDKRSLCEFELDDGSEMYLAPLQDVRAAFVGEPVRPDYTGRVGGSG